MSDVIEKKKKRVNVIPFKIEAFVKDLKPEEIGLLTKMTQMGERWRSECEGIVKRFLLKPEFFPFGKKAIGSFTKGSTFALISAFCSLVRETSIEKCARLFSFSSSHCSSSRPITASNNLSKSILYSSYHSLSTT